jgi:hypothetical protein
VLDVERKAEAGAVREKRRSEVKVLDVKRDTLTGPQIETV